MYGFTLLEDNGTDQRQPLGGSGVSPHTSSPWIHINIPHQNGGYGSNNIMAHAHEQQGSIDTVETSDEDELKTEEELAAERTSRFRLMTHHRQSVRKINPVVQDRIRLFSKIIRKQTITETPDNKSAAGHHLNVTHSRIVIYTTSLHSVRKTKSDCLMVKRVLRCLMFKTEERDIIDQRYRKEFFELFKGLTPPQIIIRNKCIGGARELEELVETGKIFEVAKGIEKMSPIQYPCSYCAGYGWTNCGTCLGSCRSRTFRLGSSREVNYLKCTMCTDGLVRCLECLDIIH